MKKIIISLVSSIMLVVFVLGGGFGWFVNDETVSPPEQNEREIVTKQQFFDEVKRINGTGEIKIPIVEISIENNSFPQDKKNYLNCSFKMSNTPDGLHDIDKPMQESVKSEGGVGIRLRGNSTMHYPKKPFRIKFNEKTSLFGLPANKSWVLLADYGYNGKSLLNYSAFTLAKSFSNLDWSPNPNHVVVFVNEQLQGLYLLTDQVDENSGRVAIKTDFDAAQDDEFPLLLEGFWLTDEEKTFEMGDLMSLELKYPEEEDCGDDYTRVVNYAQEYMMAVWTTLKTGEKVNVSFKSDPVGFDDLVEVDSLIDFYLINEIMCNAEGGGRSVYMHKTATGKLKFGPLWDFDTQFLDGDVDKDGNRLLCAQHQLFFSTFLKTKKYFDLTVARYKEIRIHMSELYVEMIEHEKLIHEVALIDSLIWLNDESEFLKGYEHVKDKLIERRQRLDYVFELSHTEFVESILSKKI